MNDVEKDTKYLNLGCGSRYISEWTNVDFIETGPGVIAYNLLQGIPFPDGSFDVVYHSHVLEHFSRESAGRFIEECYRVLKPNGLLRVAVPNLEEIAREYLQNLDGALKGIKENTDNYNWIMLELFDQMVRSKSGGEMRIYWTMPEIPNENYVASRLGQEFISFRKKFLGHEQSIRRKKKQTMRDRLISWISKDEDTMKYIELGKFRFGGEIHHWMYDRYSLKRLLSDCGFKDMIQVGAFQSQIPNWQAFQWLDVEDGKVRKPDSLFMEGKK